MSADHDVKLLSETLMVSRSGYYAWHRGKESQHARMDRTLGTQIEKVNRQSRAT